jgi:hypothetical protein
MPHRYDDATPRAIPTGPATLFLVYNEEHIQAALNYHTLMAAYLTT